ncbi:MAG: response regulator [Deltaproteobacteria bacterium]|jgi:DNA-binding response OmpR family regulator|uniref:response regulator n=1 Tax=Desulfobacula sp. TaxID=2593537 RepID=UPI001D2C7B81|nr:response regulator [Deltaproteobacteria bacterium]MBT7632071.1 response regulator [Desulfobacula sp.]MBT4091568.1 response regulator [Deltaproteobacteria bacterium]MBT4263744.1 response regulator [Deltaproteobacteria bacterium]MBT4643357.1 response regulator [Deltaproteobacteria bacterium]
MMARILVIEDDDNFRKMLNVMLTQAKYDVVEAPNGRVGLKIYRKEQIDLVITDVFMPDKEGIETTFDLKDENPNVKIIAISGGGIRDKLDLLAQMRDFGVQKTFKKPFVIGEFLAAVKELVEAD